MNFNFACKNINIKDIIKCAFGLTEGEYKILLFFIKNKGKEFDTAKIAKKNNLKKVTVQKAVKKLYKNNLILKRQKNFEKGGYQYIYSIDSDERARKELKKIIDEWVKGAKKSIDTWP